MNTAPHTPTLGTKTKNICLSVNVRKRLQRNRTVVVVGVERGGTSMVAGVLRALGLPMGERAGLNHEDPAFLQDDSEKLTKAIRKRNRMHAVWGFKAPKAALNLPFFDDALRNPHYVVVYRNSLSVADSWRQRGAGEAISVLKRIGTYHNAILELAEQTKAPVLFVNYERAVVDDAAKRAMVHEISTFAGLDADGELSDRAIGMITGDGKGYVNLPEHHFLVEPQQMPGTREDLPLIEELGQERDARGWVQHADYKPLITYRLASGGNLPSRFWVDVDFDGTAMNVKDNPLRVFFNFTGDYFTGHCTRPPVQVGHNRFWVETSGNATHIGFGPMNVPSGLKLTARAYVAHPDDMRAESAVNNKANGHQKVET